MSDNPQTDQSGYTNGIISLPTDQTGQTIEARLDFEFGWHCDDPDTLANLTRLFPFPDNPNLDFSPSNPNPMLDLMTEVIALMGGEITQVPESTAPPGTVF